MFDFAPSTPCVIAAGIPTFGLVAGTKVATREGWRPVEGILAGDECLTFDGGLQPVVQVTRRTLERDALRSDPANWPLIVPAGALGNREEMILLPDQSVLVESDTAEAVFGDPFAMIPALALTGLRGIHRAPPQAAFEVITLGFACEEVVYANAGALFHCPARTDLLSDACGAVYSTLSLDRAELLVRHLDLEDRGRADPARARQEFLNAA